VSEQHKEIVSLNILKAERDGLTKVYFPNGTTFEMFRDQCFDCRHHIDDMDNPKPATLTPPPPCGSRRMR